MALNMVTLTFTEQDAGDDAGTGQVSIAPTTAVVAAGQTVVSTAPVVRSFSGGTLSVSLVATDNSGTTPAAGFWAYEITLPGGQPQTYLLPYSSGSSQRFDNLSPAVAETTYGPAASSGGGSGTVTTVSVATANGFAGTVANATTTPAVTVETTVTGLLKGNGTAVAAATSGTDYAPATSGSAILKGNGSGGFSSAASGTDYAPATSGSAILKGNGSGGFSSAASGTDYAPATSGSAILKGNGSGGFSAATAGTDYVAPSGQTFTGAVIPAVVALTDGATIAVNAALGNVFTVTLGGNRTMNNPTNPVAGQTITFHLTQDGSGSRTVTWSSAYDFGTAGAPTLTTTAGKVDIVGFTYDGGLSKWCCLGSGLGF